MTTTNTKKNNVSCVNKLILFIETSNGEFLYENRFKNPKKQLILINCEGRPIIFILYAKTKF